MHPEVADMIERMSQGGDIVTFRIEVAGLHAVVKTEEDYVILLSIHRSLMDLGKSVYSDETYEKFLAMMDSEYRQFLNREASGPLTINPVDLERITRREVEAGRLAPDDRLRKLAVAGANVFGDTSQDPPTDQRHHCRRGDSFFFGVVSAAALSVGLVQIDVSPFWLILPGLLIGTFLNNVRSKPKP